MELEEIRKKIDETDGQLLELFCRRMDLVREVAAYKIEHRMEVLRPEREQAILERVAGQAEPGYGEYAVDFFSELMRISRQMQQKMILAAEDSAPQMRCTAEEDSGARAD